MRLTLVLLLSVALVAGCSIAEPNGAVAKSNQSRLPADQSAAPLAAAAINAFGLDLYRALLDAQPADNAVISPASIAIALAMARAGARGQTADQMDAVMHSLGADSLAEAMNALDAALAARSGSFRARDGNDYTLTLRIANAPFAQQDTAWQQAFLDALAQRFGAGVRLVDYKTNPEAARAQINGWVSDQTERRIPELIGQGVLDQLTRLVLVNAIYLKAAWQTPFSADATSNGDFTRRDGSTVAVPMMRQQSEFAYAAGDGWRAVELPYVGEKLALDVIVPDDLTSFSTTLNADSFAALTDALAPAEVNLWLPKFETETRADLADVLTALGMSNAFDPNRADFSGMTTEEQLYVSDVIHQANISVDEKGTEAAAATAVVMGTTSAPAQVVEFHVDRPFMFALRDTVTGAVLFLGQISDPSAGPAQ